MVKGFGAVREAVVRKSSKQSKAASRTMKEFWANKTPEERTRIWQERATKAWETKRTNAVKEDVGMEIRKWVVRPGVNDVVSVFMTHYELRYRRKVKSGRNRQGIQDNLAHLVKRVGVEEAKEAIKVIFTSPKLKWVSACFDSFLANPSNYEKFVQPVLLARPPGEQSEWKGPRDGESREMSAAEFFSEGNR